MNQTKAKPSQELEANTWSLKEYIDRCLTTISDFVRIICSSHGDVDYRCLGVLDDLRTSSEMKIAEMVMITEKTITEQFPEVNTTLGYSPLFDLKENIGKSLEPIGDCIDLMYDQGKGASDERYLNILGILSLEANNRSDKAVKRIEDALTICIFTDSTEKFFLQEKVMFVSVAARERTDNERGKL